MTLCEVCLEPSTADDIGGMCNTCWRDWQEYQKEKADWEVAE